MILVRGDFRQGDFSKELGHLVGLNTFDGIDWDRFGMKGSLYKVQCMVAEGLPKVIFPTPEPCLFLLDVRQLDEKFGFEVVRIVRSELPDQLFNERPLPLFDAGGSDVPRLFPAHDDPVLPMAVCDKGVGLCTVVR